MANLGQAARLIRYVFQDNHVTISTRNINWRAFAARFVPASSKFELSVFDKSTMTEIEINQLGFEHVAALQGRDPKFWIELGVTNVTTVSLAVESEPSTHPLHANIVDWPVSEDERLERAKQLALNLKNDLTVNINTSVKS